MFHEFHPSEISLASQRLRKLCHTLEVSALEAASSGYELQLESTNGRFKNLKLFPSRELLEDYFFQGFWLAERELMRERPLIEMCLLTFREWESYFRDLNHQMIVSEGELSRCEKLHQQLIGDLAQEIFSLSWERSVAQCAGGSTNSWIESLAWLKNALEGFARELGAVEGAFELYHWHSECLTIGASGKILSSPLLQNLLQNFLLGAVKGTNEIKLVAE